MINAETAIYNAVMEKLMAREGLPKFHHVGEKVRMPEKLPMVSLREVDNSTDRATRSTGGSENFAVLTYEAEVFSNKSTGKKQECRAIMDALDEILLGMNFRRMSLKPSDNMSAGSIYRMTGRYEVLIDIEGRLYYRR